MTDTSKLDKKDFWRWVELKAQFMQMLIAEDEDRFAIAEEQERVKLAIGSYTL
jgi:hypothetical protein